MIGLVIEAIQNRSSFWVLRQFQWNLIKPGF
jgi:hypothetical protein